jgi:hypothetical protein
MTRQNFAALALAIALGCIGVQRTAAQAEPSDDAYEGLVARSIAAFDAGKFMESRDLLLRAHQLRPNARTLRGMGLAAYEAGKYALAVLDLERALAETRQPMTPDQRAEVERIYDQANALTARYRLMGQPPGAAILVDQSPPLWDAAGFLLLDQGKHELRLKLASGEVRAFEIEAAGGQWVDFDLDPPAPSGSPPPPIAGHSPWVDREPEKPAPAAAPAPVFTQPRVVRIAPTPKPPPPEAPVRSEPISAPEPESPTSPERVIPRVLGYAALGSAAIAAGISIWQWREREAEVSSWNSDACLDGGRNRRDNCARYERAYERAETWSWVMAGAAVALSAGAVSLLVWMDDDDHDEAAHTRCVPGAALVTCQVRF